MRKIELINYFLLFIIASLFVFDLFINIGEPATMDGRIHATSITQFADAIQQGQFPVIWLNNFANYGLPVGIFSHQLPLYLGSLIESITNDPVLSTNILTFVGIVLTNWLFYYFLRLYVSPLSALTATILLSIAPYRILNVYIRGAVPETFSAFFLPLILICLYWLFHKKNKSAFFFLLFSIAALALTHPMMFLIYTILIIPYAGYLIIRDKKNIKVLLTRVAVLISAFFLGLGMASYYLIPLVLEKKYFYFGQWENLLNDSFLGTQNFFGSQWYYFYQTDIATRGHVIQVGLPEMVFFFVGILFLWKIFQKKKANEQLQLLLLVVLVGAIILFLMTPFAKGVYGLISPLQNIQFPWRLLSLFIFIPPVILAIILDRIRFKWVIILIVIIIAGLRFPQMYGKNYTIHSNEYYARTLENLHSVGMNTVWTGKTEEYPVRIKQAEIIDGRGTLQEKTMLNTHRQYIITGQEPLRVVDYTFYFPGWKVFVDKKEIPLEFQDSQYRGMITYSVPSGEHTVDVTFMDTLVRKSAKAVSLGFVGIVVLFFVFRKRIFERISRYV